MAAQKIKMKALRTFEGTEGLVRRGDVFEVEGKERADQLAKLQLAERTDAGEVTNLGQLSTTLDGADRSTLEKQAEAAGVNYTDETTDDELRAAILRDNEQAYIEQQAAQTEGTNHPAPGESK